MLQSKLKPSASQEAGRIYMIRLILVLFLVSSCSYINYGELPQVLRTSVFGVDIKIDQAFYDSQDYSFLKINIGKSVVAVLVLAEVIDDQYTWVSENNEKIITQHGRIIDTYGLTYDVSILDAFNLAPVHQKKDSDLLRQLRSPEALVHQSSSIDNIGLDHSYKHLNESTSSALYIENMHTDILKWKFKNKYWVNLDNGRVLKSEQFIHPHLPLISLEFFYK